MATNFQDLSVSPALGAVLGETFSYGTPTDVQKAVIPQALAGRDILASSPTGSGKTMAYLVPIVEKLRAEASQSRMPRSLIIVPTKEVALQVTEVLEKIAEPFGLDFALLVGGLYIESQIKKLKRHVDIIIATPGRLLDLLEREYILPLRITTLVIDEADRMFDMGFIGDITTILRRLPERRQTMMFSATVTPVVKKLVQEHLFHPVEVYTAAVSSASSTISHYLIKTQNKLRCLLDLIEEKKISYALIFCNRKVDVDRIAPLLREKKLNAKGLHGDLPQSVRFEIFTGFRNRDFGFLVCSDVAARGLDISAVDFVINLDVPINPEDYVHRIGRTGRAGRTGEAFTMVTSSSVDERNVRRIEQLLKKDIPIYTPSTKRQTQRRKAPEGKRYGDEGQTTPTFLSRPIVL